MRVTEVNSTDGLPGLRLAWRSMLDETPGATFQQSCEWLEASARYMPPASKLRVLLVTGGGETIGLLPLIQTDQQTLGGRLRVLGYPRDAWSPFRGPIGPQPTATLMSALRHLAGCSDWDVIELTEVNRSGLDYERTRTALQVAEMRFREETETAIPAIDLPIPWAWNPINSLGRQIDEKKVCPTSPRSDKLSFERYRPQGAMYGDMDPRWGDFETCLALPKGDRHQSNTAQTFLREVHQTACRYGAADLNILRCRGRIVAACYNVHLDGTMATLFSGCAREARSTARLTDGDALPAWQARLVDLMLQSSSQDYDDHRWLPGDVDLVEHRPSTSLQRVSFVHRRPQSALQRVRRMARNAARRYRVSATAGSP